MSGTRVPDDPTSLADIALRRTQHDPATTYLYAIDATVPDEVREVSYGQISDRSAALFAVLAEAGVAPGERIGCYLDNTPSWVVASLATWWAGCGVAAAGTLLPGREAAGLFEMAGVRVVIASTDAPDLPNEFVVIRVDSDGIVSGAIPSGTIDPQDVTLPDPDALAVAIFTSGTTGKPKGVTHSHGDIVASARRVAAAYARNPGYRPEPAPSHLPPGVLFNPFGHMAGYSRLAFRMWIGRPTAIVSRFTVAAARAVLDRFPIDSLQLTPTMIQMLATADDEIDMSSVKYVTSGTAPLSVATREAFERRFEVPVMQAYGMSELGAVAQERFDDVVAGRRGPGSVGRLAKGVEIDIRPLDDDRPDGEGEIWVRTDEASDQYIGGASLPVDADGWFQTGDVGRMEGDILYITGRVQEKMIVGGFNVYPAEVEEVARLSSLVRDAVVVGIPDERLGERPVAGIVWTDEPDEDALIQEMGENLSRYKVPRQLFAIEMVPLTSRDKIDRARAMEMALEALGSAGTAGSG